MVAEDQAQAARSRRVDRNVVPAGEAIVRANNKDMGIGWFSKLMYGRTVEYFAHDTDRNAVIGLAYARMHELGLRLSSD